MSSILQKYSEFVIKLKLVGTGAAPQIRRVRLKNIAVGPVVSYDELVTLAIAYTYPNTSCIDLEDFEVTLTYYDIDNDCVTLATSDELVDAIEQYADAGGRGTLRLTTDVRRKKSKSRKSSSESSSRKSTSRSSTPPSTMTASPPESPVPPETTTTTPVPPTEEIPAAPEPTALPSVTSPRLHASSPHSQLQALLESFVSILAAAVVAIQSLSPPPPPLTADASTTNAAAPETVPATEGASVPVEAAEETPTAVEDPVAPVIDMPQSSSPPAASDEPEETAESPPEPTVQVPDEPTIHVEPELVCVDPIPSEIPQLLPSVPVARGVVNEEEPRPFIHGRHTCDGCLSTPIVGIRYHATNLKDYDLCEKCKDNYKGTEIHFEPVELERDRAFQDRWHRRRNKWSQYGGRCRGPGPRQHGVRPGHHHHHHPPPFGPPEAMPPPPPFGAAGPPHLFGPPIPPHIFGHPPPPPPGPEEFDAALKEAIQRSLKDLMEKHAATTSAAGEQTKEAAPVVVPTETPATSVTNVDEATNQQTTSVEAVTRTEENAVVEPEESVESTEKSITTEPVNDQEWVKDGLDESKAVVDTEKVVQGSEASTASKAEETEAKDVVCDLFVCKDETKESVETVVAAIEPEIEVAVPKVDSQEVAKPADTVVTSNDRDFSFLLSYYANDDVATELRQALDECSRVLEAAIQPEIEVAVPKVDSKEVAKPADTVVTSKDDDFGILPSYEEIATSTELSFPMPHANSSSPVKSENESEIPSLEEPSFSSDAFGNGDVAEALGQTLDKCARAIDDMVNELARADSRESDFQHNDDDSDAASSHQASAGATILEAVEDGDTKTQSAAKLDDEKSDDGWQVVTDSEQVADDEILARAAQVIGSALFNSDVSRSGVISTLSGSAGESVSTELSVPTVPSVVPSLATAEDNPISLAQLHRFAVQLKQLHELGFQNDNATIEILERLTAANVGADLFEEVSVTQVVNELLSRE